MYNHVKETSFIKSYVIKNSAFQRTNESARRGYSSVQASLEIHDVPALCHE